MIRSYTVENCNPQPESFETNTNKNGKDTSVYTDSRTNVC
jgi:hypothetical protein